MDKKGMKDLFVHAYRGTTPDPTKFSNEDVKASLSKALHELASDFNSYRRNKLDIFEILQEAYDEILPKYVEDFMGNFAEIKTVANGKRAQFVVKRGAQRAKQFVTQVGLAGIYEAFRLDKDTFELGGKAIGGAAIIDFERYICGDEDMSESATLLMEGLQEAVMGEIQKALISAAQSADRPAKNYYAGAGFNAQAMANLCAVAKVYGGGATIFAAPEFIAAMGPDAVGMPIGSGTPGYGYATPAYSPKDLADIAATGYITTFRGNPIIQIPQSYTDETNEITQINPGFAYIFPTGGEKIVKIVFEGETQVDDYKNRDRSMELQVYKKFGVAILTHHNWCIYENTSLSTADTKYPCPVTPHVH